VLSSLRHLAIELGRAPALLAHRYAPSLPDDTVVLGIKNRIQLAEHAAPAEAGPLSPDSLARVYRLVDPAADGQRQHALSGQCTFVYRRARIGDPG
jgi:hypothetical protein